LNFNTSNSFNNFDNVNNVDSIPFKSNDISPKDSESMSTINKSTKIKNSEEYESSGDLIIIENIDTNSKLLNNKDSTNLVSIENASISLNLNSSYNMDIVSKVEYYNDKVKFGLYENSNDTNLETKFDQSQIEQIEILNEKLCEKQEDIKLVIENFDVLITNPETSNTKQEDFIKELLERESLLKQSLENLKRDLDLKSNENSCLNKSIQDLMSELNKGENHRKKLHNYIQELRGNIRVYCRVKPIIEKVNSYLLKGF
jgi:chromosome segregation ATPase